MAKSLDAVYNQFFHTVQKPDSCLMADQVRLRRDKHRLIKVMCSTSLADRTPCFVLHQRVGIDKAIEELIVQICLQWYRQVLQVDVKGKQSQGRPKKI